MMVAGFGGSSMPSRRLRLRSALLDGVSMGVFSVGMGLVLRHFSFIDALGYGGCAVVAFGLLSFLRSAPPRPRLMWERFMFGMMTAGCAVGLVILGIGPGAPHLLLPLLVCAALTVGFAWGFVRAMRRESPEVAR